MRLYRSINTDAKAVGEGEEELVEVGEDVVVDEWVVEICLVGHDGDGEEEDQSCCEDEVEGFDVEDVLEFCAVLTHGVSDVVDQQEVDDGPGDVDVLEGFAEGGSWEEYEADDEGEHDDEGVGEDRHAGLVEGFEVVLFLDFVRFRKVLIVGETILD
jgi:hypothetical protein